MTAKRRIIKSLEMTEIALVGDPAHDEARIVVMKAKPKPERKAGESDEDYAARCKAMGAMKNQAAKSGEEGEAPAAPSDELVAGEAEGIGEGKNMADAKSTAEADLLKAATDERDRLAKRVAKLENLAKATDAEKAFGASISDEEERESFFASKSGDKASAIAKAADRNPVIFKSADGTEYRQADARAAAQHKRSDELAKKLADMELDKRGMLLKAKAELELSHLTGDVDTKVEMLKACETIEDQAVRTRVLEMLKSQDAGMAKLYKSIGHASVPASGSSQVEAMAKAKSKEKGISYEKAMVEIMSTDEGQRLALEGVR